MIDFPLFMARQLLLPRFHSLSRYLAGRVCRYNNLAIVSSSKNRQDAMLINQTWEKFDAVFEAKSRAAAFLHDAPET